jgi:hypothetical protein
MQVGTKLKSRKSMLVSETAVETQQLLWRGSDVDTYSSGIEDMDAG